MTPSTRGAARGYGCDAAREAGVQELEAGLLDGDAELAAPSVLDLLSDEVAGLDSALPPSFAEDDSFADDSFEDVSFEDVSFPDDSELVAFFRASDG